MSETDSKGMIITLSAPSGAGKTTLAKALSEHLEGIRTCISYTTRPMRNGEVDGKNYHFVSEVVFDKMVSEGAFVESAIVFGHQYGTAFTELGRASSNDHDTILDIDWQGAKSIAEAFLERCVRIFIMPPSRASLLERLNRRGQDELDVIDARMQQACSEMGHYHEADYLIINQQFEQALSEIAQIIVAERLKLSRQRTKHVKILKELLD